MGLSPGAEAIRKKRRAPGQFKLFGNKTGCGFAKFATQKSGAKCAQRNGFVSGDAFAAAKNLGATLLRQNRSVSAGRHP
jgi:hypothetical protein